MNAARAQGARLAAALPGLRPGRGRFAAAPGRGPRVSPRLVLVVVSLIAVLGAGWLWLRDSSLVKVKRVEVTGLSGPDAAAATAALARAARTMTTLHVRDRALRQAVASFPLVRSLDVDARPPDVLAIRVRLERPVALVTGPGRPQAVTAEGKVLSSVPAGAALPAVPVRTEAVGGRVKGARTLGALAALDAAPAALRRRVERMVWTPARGLTASLRDGPALYLGPATRLRSKWLAVARVLADPSSQGARYIDARVPERPAAGGVAPPPDAEASASGAAPAGAAPGAATPAGPAAPAAPAPPSEAAATAPAAPGAGAPATPPGPSPQP